MSATTYGWLVLAFPLLGTLVIAFGFRSLPGRYAGWIGTAAIGLAFVAALGTLIALQGHSPSHRELESSLWDYASTVGVNARLSILVDPLSVYMILIVTGISTMIHLYSISYMDEDRGNARFFSYLNFFVFSMLLLVLAGNFLLLIVGWAFVGAASYLLISFWYRRTTATQAGIKAFVINVVGDVGLVLGTYFIFKHTHTLNFLATFKAAPHVFAKGEADIVAGCLLLLVGACAKSAQIPLFNWLPDAMEGPTPVSALTHAATMVTAGVYLLCRMNPLLVLSHAGTEVIAVIGGVTAFVAATIACAQKDIKKVLAFSTVSQIGYMILAVGVGAYAAAIFLMVAHAFFKALLFLGSGSVIHSLNGEQDMRKMGGLAKYLPYTFPTFLIGWLTISGVPPFAGFFAKGDVLTNVFQHNKPLWVLGIITAFLTAYYMSRLFVLTFRGTERFREETHGHDPHESPWVMTFPLVVLAMLSVLGGLINLPWAHSASLSGFLGPVFGYVPAVAGSSTVAQWGLAAVDVVVAVLGLLAAFSIWKNITESSRYESPFLEHVWHWDDFYDATIGRPLTRLAYFSDDVIEPKVIDGAV